MAQPNILYLHSHDTGRFVEPYGHAIPTPNIQRLAEEGILFRQAFCAAPTCSPSRACLVTGQWAHSNGMLGLAHRGFTLNDYSHHIVNYLREAGYESTLVGIQHIHKDPNVIGYDKIVEVEGNKVEQVVPAAVDFIRSGPKEPFFLSVGTGETHRAFRDPGPEENAAHTLPPAPLPDTPETREDMAAFKATARELDRGFGEVLGALEETGLAENTLVICTTDHGIAFPKMKCQLYDGGIGVMLIMRGPGGFEGGRAIDALVSQIDIFPTICELVGLDVPEWVQGMSMMPLVRGEVDEINEQICADVTYHAAYEPQRTVRTRRWKYIRRFGDRLKPVLSNVDNSPSKTVWIDKGWGEMDIPQEQLYDLVFDPNESDNLAADPSHREVLEDMRGRMDAWMKASDDPLLKGSVPAPSGSVITMPDEVDPRGRTMTIQ
ncbi:MAG: sulfatase [Theionarchaea archaeon]|nr:sulfatase [Theionarchaea archaeon]